MRQSRVILLLLAMVWTTVAWAQKQSISGVVKDDVGETLIGVAVIVKDSKTSGTGLVGTITDIDGRYSIMVNPTDVLVFSFIGFENQEVVVAGKTVIDITMNISSEMLSDVVVVGYGAQKKNSVVAAIAQVKGDEVLKQGSPTTISAAMQGMMPGVTAMNEDGKPGSDAAEILIRGKASWQNSNPLVLVDGVERNMNDVDPNEIETISVLKDGSATAVYGMKGGNGVILITTKRGSVKKPTVSFNANFGVKQPTTEPEFADYVTSMEMWNQALKNDKSWDKLLSETRINSWRENMDKAGPYNDYYPNIDWWNEMVRTVGYQQQYNVNVNGGSEFVKYFASLGYLNDGDIFKTVENELFDPAFYYKRYNFRSNFDFALTKSTTFSVDLSGKVGYRNQSGYRVEDEKDQSDDDNFGQPQFFQQLYTASQNEFPIMYSDGKVGTSDVGGGNLVTNFDRGQRIYRYYDGFADFKLNQKLDFVLKGLVFNAKYSYNTGTAYLSNIQRYSGTNFGEAYPIRYNKKWDYDNPNADGSLNELTALSKRFPNVTEVGNPAPTATYDMLMKDGYSKNEYYEFALNYSQSFGNHDVTGLLLFARDSKKGLKSTSDKNMQVPNNSENVVARVTYEFKKRYQLEMNGAYNGSSAFAPDQRYDFFPSFSAGWIISEEPLVKKLTQNFLDRFKVRYSHGQSGYDKIDGLAQAYQQIYTSGGNVEFGTTSRSTYGPLYKEGAAANENATWEKATKQNLGFETMFFKNLTLNLDLYNEERTDILMNVWNPLWLGIKDPKGNVGETKNRGLEIEAGWNQTIKPDLKVWVKGNMAFNENRIVFRNDGANTAEHLAHAGKPIGWNDNAKLVSLGYYSNIDDIFNYSVPLSSTNQMLMVPGDLMFADYDANGVVETNKDKVAMEHMDYPMNTFGFSFGCSYKRLDLSVMFYGVSDISKQVPTLALYDFIEGVNGNYKALENVTGAWTPSNAGSAVKPVLHSNPTARGYSQTASSFSYNNAAYIRLKNVELTYTFKPFDAISLQKLQVYLNGNNLFTWTDYNDILDPESKDAGVYPVIRRFNIGFRATF